MKVIFYVQLLIKTYKENKWNLAMIFIDLEKAYDSPKGSNARRKKKGFEWCV